MKTVKLIKTLAAVGLISTAKIAANYLLDNPEVKEKEDEDVLNPAVIVYETDITNILANIRVEMNAEMAKLEPEEKLLRNYVKGRIATLDDIEKRFR